MPGKDIIGTGRGRRYRFLQSGSNEPDVSPDSRVFLFREWDNIVVPCQEPRDGQLCGSTIFFLSHRLDARDEIEILIKILTLKRGDWRR